MIDLLDTPTPLDTASELVFPDTWRRESRVRYQALADMGLVDQREVDRVEEQLVWYRHVRDEYANKSETT